MIGMFLLWKEGDEPHEDNAAYLKNDEKFDQLNTLEIKIILLWPIIRSKNKMVEAKLNGLFNTIGITIGTKVLPLRSSTIGVSI